MKMLAKIILYFLSIALIFGITEIKNAPAFSVISFILGFLIMPAISSKIKENIKFLQNKFIYGFLIFSLFMAFGATAPQSINSNPVSKNTPQKPLDKKAVFLKFEKEIYSIPKQCDADYNVAAKNIENYNFIDAYSNFDTAHYSCLDASNNIEKIKIPESLDSNLQEKLKSATENLSNAYIFKYSACKNFKKYLDKKDIKYVSKAKEDLNLYQNKLFSGIAYLTDVKTTLKIK